MAEKKSLKERKAAKLSSMAEKATKVIRSSNKVEFNRGWLAQQLGITDREAAQIASQLKKDMVLYGENKMGDDENIVGTLYRVRPVKS
jgi:hypothetical protein